MTEPIRIGVIGTSWWADLYHLPVFSTDERVKIVAICGRNRERAQAMATKYDIPQIFTDYRAMIVQGGLQAIVISTPDDEHFPMTMAALDAGLHVLCEKPLALNAAHAKTMYERAEATDRRHLTLFSWRWLPHYRYIRDLISQGELGRIEHMQLSFIAGGGRNQHYSWRVDPQHANGIIGDSGSHMFDLARYLVGDIARVNARLISTMHRTGLDGQPMTSACDAATAMIEFANGAQATIEVSMVARINDPAFEQAITLHGEAGSLTASFGMLNSAPKLQRAKGNEGYQPLVIPASYLSGIDPAQPLGQQMKELFTQPDVGGRLFVDAILAGQTVAPSFYEGWQVQRVIDAAIASHERGGWVAV